MQNTVDLRRHPLDRPGTLPFEALVNRCKDALAADGMFSIEGFLTPAAVTGAVQATRPLLDTDSFRHARRHNIYFRPEVPGLASDHPALEQFETVNHTICADQLAGTSLATLYKWPPFAAFLARVMDKTALYPMADPLAGVNAMAYHAGEALNWHFDRSEFTTTLLLQAPEAGGTFEYRTGLRSEDDPNYAGVARLLTGQDLRVRQLELHPGTLNVFRGRNTAHRVTPVEGPKERIIAVFSYFDRPDVNFSDDERVGFYGRTGRT